MAVPEEDIRVVCTDGFVFIRKLCGLGEWIDKAKAFESLAECDVFVQACAKPNRKRLHCEALCRQPLGGAFDSG